MSHNYYSIDNSRHPFIESIFDFKDGFKMYHLWGRLGWNDILQRYRRSFFGPFWLTISMAVLVGALGFLYANLFKVELADYLPFLAIGFILWQLVSGILLDGCNVFVHSEGVIKQIKLPLSLHVYRLLWRNLLTFFHNAIVIVFVMYYFDIPVTYNTLGALAGLILIILNGTWFSFLLGMLCARYRDLNPTIGSLVTLSFFVTPIIWNPSLIPDRAYILLYNPFYHFVESIRGPLLGTPVATETWLILIAITFIGWLIVLPAAATMHRRLVYWL